MSERYPRYQQARSAAGAPTALHGVRRRAYNSSHMFALFLVLCCFEGGGADSGASNEEVIVVALRWCVCADTRLQLNSSTENLFDSLCAHPSRSSQTRGRDCVITPLPSVRIEQSQKKNCTIRRQARTHAKKEKTSTLPYFSSIIIHHFLYSKIPNLVHSPPLPPRLRLLLRSLFRYQAYSGFFSLGASSSKRPARRAFVWSKRTLVSCLSISRKTMM